MAFTVSILLVTGPLSVAPAGSAPFGTLSASFTHTRSAGDEREVVRGLVYVDEHRTRIVVTEPLAQWVFEDSAGTVLYYPDSHRAIQLATGSKQALPPYDPFRFTDEADVLARLGFALGSSVQRGDTLLAVWQPPTETRGLLGPATVKIVRDRLVETRMTTSRGAPLSETTYTDHVACGRGSIALSVTHAERTADGVVVQQTVYSEPVCGGPLPPAAAEIILPADVIPESATW